MNETRPITGSDAAGSSAGTGMPVPDARDLLRRALTEPRLTGGRAAGWEPPPAADVAAMFPSCDEFEFIGRGGMGALYRARQISLGRLVAIKLLPLELSVEPDFANRFRREAQAMARLRHPNIVAVHDFGETPDGQLFIMMEFVAGRDLQQVIRDGSLTVVQALDVVRQVCGALEHAHAAGLVHRDVKPANVLIDSDGRARVTDFGVARLKDTVEAETLHTVTGGIVGTPEYIAPEQLHDSQSVDHRADIYSLGVMLYELLTGSLPRGAFDPPSRRVAVDRHVDSVVERALQNEPGRRYQRAAEMGDDLAHAPGRGRHWWWWAAAAALLVAGVAAAVKSLPFQNEHPAAGGKTAELDRAWTNSLGLTLAPAGTKDVLVSTMETRQRDFETFARETNYEVPEPVYVYVDGEWSASSEYNWKRPFGYEPAPEYPVTCVSYHDALEFCRWLTARESALSLIAPGTAYRLPLESEWIAAAGDTTARGASRGNVAGAEMTEAGIFAGVAVVPGWKDEFASPAPAGKFPANAFGLFDIDGNVSEWLGDTDPDNPGQRLVRGSAWIEAPGSEPGTERWRFAPATRGFALGFRIVLARIELNY